MERGVAAFIKQHKAWIVGPAIVILVFAFFVHFFGWDWTGFVTDTGEGIKPSETGNGRIVLVQLPKRLWDWLGLLVVPTSLAGGALWFNKLQGEAEQRRATDREREAALQAYFDAMSALLLSKDHPLRKSYRRDDVRSVARGRTLAILRAVNAARNVQVLQFLRDSHLVVEEQHIIDFAGADLSGDDLQNVNLAGLRLLEANLSRANLSKANLSGTDLSKATLSEANLTKTTLTGANLSKANLIRADLTGANLIRADLTGANLTGANLCAASLRGADLREADLTNANLSEADLTDAILPQEQQAQAMS